MWEYCKVSNQNRIAKREKETLPRNRRERVKAEYKCWSYLMIPRMMHKFGYDYEPDSQVMAVLKESFESKCRTYFAGTRVNKMGTKDKRELKERTGFQLSTHPVLSLFDKIHRANIWPVLQEALSAIVAVSEQQKLYHR